MCVEGPLPALYKTIQAGLNSGFKVVGPAVKCKAVGAGKFSFNGIGLASFVAAQSLG